MVLLCCSQHKMDRSLPNCLRGCRCRILVGRKGKKNVPKSSGEEGNAEQSQQKNERQQNNENYYCSVEEMAYDAMYDEKMPAEERDKTGTVLQRVAMALQGKAGPEQYQQFK